MSMLITARRWAVTRPLIVLLIAAAIVSAGALSATYALTASTTHSRQFPHNAQLESQLGVRFSRLAVVGDGGLLELSFVVLDSDKATSFEASLARPPVIVSETRSGSTSRVSIMKQGHNLLPGQTYYLVYENTRGAVQPGGWATVVVGQAALKHIPVL
ncbi:MAG TPA: hypothetical protein VKB75_00685 [Jatrophihabitans sp.]|nr:hypothetical protein [Jatrophihabitans sp.]